MSFPPAHFLVGVGAAELVRSAVPLPRWRAWLVAGALAVSPDLDLVVGLATGLGGHYHGTFTHSALAVVVVTLVAAAVGGRAWAMLAGAGYGSHLLVDLLDDRGRTNVLLGWPLTDTQPDALARVFPQVSFVHGHGLTGAFLSLFHQPTVGELFRQTLVGALFCAALVAWALLIRLMAGLRARGET
jgi:hypothetical protein